MPETTAPPPPAEITPPTNDPGAVVSNIADVYADFDAADAPAAPAPKKDAGQSPPPKSGGAKPATTASGASSGEDTSKTAKDTSASPAGSDADKGKTGFKNITDEEYARLDKAGRVAFNKSLREQNASLERELRTLRSEFEKAKAKPADDGRVKELEEILDSTRNQLKEAQEHLRLTAYERSDEFNEKYKKPYIAAYGMGRNKAASLKVIERKNDVDEVVQQARQGTQEDFDQIMRIADDDAASQLADQLFGNKASMILYYRERVQELHSASQAAIEDRKTNAERLQKEQTEAQKRQAEQTEAQQKEMAGKLRREIDAGQKAHPEWFTPIEGDEESAGIVETGKAVADSLFTGVNPKTGRPYTPDGMVRFHAFVRNAIAAHGPLAHQVGALRAKVASLEAELSEFKESATLEDAGRKGGDEGGVSLPGREEFEEADRRSR